MELLHQLIPYVLNWFDLLIRWIHIIAGIAWIGSSFYFTFVEFALDREVKKEGVEGELWAVHGGGFYTLNKLKGPPKQFPKTLHWFYIESYTTWISGLALLIIVLPP